MAAKKAAAKKPAGKTAAQRMDALEEAQAANRAAILSLAAVVGGLNVESQLKDEQAAAVAAAAKLAG